MRQSAYIIGFMLKREPEISKHTLKDQERYDDQSVAKRLCHFGHFFYEERLYRAFRRDQNPAALSDPARTSKIHREDIYSGNFHYYDSMSVNRSTLCEPLDVLFTQAVKPTERDQWGVAYITFEQTNNLFTSDDQGQVADLLGNDITLNGDHAMYKGSRWEFRVEHVPKADNYAHAEVNLLKNGEYRPGNKEKECKPPPAVKMAARLCLQYYLLDQIFYPPV
jgi:hypothetical protein